jgi:DNA-directed RNA polymerase subunit RPC12/RpoP
MKNSYKFKCKICGNSMVKAGKNSTGKQRYKCNHCNTRTVVKKENKQRQNELKLFAKWITDSTKVIDKIEMSRRTFYRKTNWCWGVIPKIKSEDISSDFIFVDATYINKNLCLLIVRNDKHVLGFRWA